MFPASAAGGRPQTDMALEAEKQAEVADEFDRIISPGSCAASSSSPRR